MKLYEYEGVELFKQGGIPVPDFAIATTAEEAREKANAIGVPLLIKAQVLTGGRYLAGGVRTVDSLDRIEETARRILSSKIRGLPVNKVMLAASVDVTREYYCSITIDDYHGTPLVIFSAEGGVDINQIAQEREEAVAQKAVSISRGLELTDARKMCRQVGLKGKDLDEIPGILVKLYQVFRNNDAILAEINPLVKTKKGDYVALDSKIELDDSSLYRHTDLGFDQIERITNPLEKAGREIGVSYLELDGDIAIIASGAGLGMASMDIVSKRLSAANFLETGGAITEELLYNVMDLVLQKEGIRGLFINVYGGINPIHEGAKGVVRYLKEHNITVPVVAKALGNHQEETWQIFRENGVHVTSGVSTEEGVEMLAGLLEGTR
ncbi:MAG: acetate--CoA ligase family protein [Dehalococcoidales bacterium]|nr:MAG: acetate--CoA ligase family protein [Dehalococcoidales bacterium]